MTAPSGRPRRTTGWYLFYLAAVAVGVLAGLGLFDWVTS
jgi:hypothetical protein